MTPPVMVGTVLRLRRDKGFGFLTTGTNSKEDEYFFHSSDCLPGAEFDSLDEGMTVQWQPGTSAKGNGKRAMMVARV